MTRKFLEDLGLEKEVIDKVLDEAGKDLSNAKGELDTLKKEKESLNGQLKDRDKQLEDLKKNQKDNAELTKTIENLQNENKTAKENYDKSIRQIKVDNAVELALTNAKAKNKVAVKALLKDLDKAEILEDGTIKGLADQIKGLTEAEDSKFLFDAPTQTVMKGVTPGASSNKAITGGDDTSKMTYSQMMAYKEAHPNAEF